MTERAQVLSEFIDAWNAGRRPRALDYLQRVPAGPQRDALADELGTWLELAPAAPQDGTTRDAIRAHPAVAGAFAASGDAPLLPRLRAAAGLSVGELARGVVERFRLGAGNAERASDYLQRLERGELDADGLSRRLLDGLGGLLGVSGATVRTALAGGGARPAVAGGVVFRGGEDADAAVLHDIEVLSLAAMSPAPAPMDELDRLFCGGADA